jgi:hypothetical protein
MQDQALAGSPGRDDALTQLTAKHGTSRWIDRRAGSCPDGVACPKRGGLRNAAQSHSTRAARTTTG